MSPPAVRRPRGGAVLRPPPSRQPPRRARRSRRAARGRKRKWGRGDHGAAGAGKEPPPAPGERAGVSGTGEGRKDGPSRAESSLAEAVRLAQPPVVALRGARPGGGSVALGAGPRGSARPGLASPPPTALGLCLRAEWGPGRAGRAA